MRNCNHAETCHSPSWHKAPRLIPCPRGPMCKGLATMESSGLYTSRWTNQLCRTAWDMWGWTSKYCKRLQAIFELLLNQPFFSSLDNGYSFQNLVIWVVSPITPFLIVLDGENVFKAILLEFQSIDHTYEANDFHMLHLHVNLDEAILRDY